MNLTKKGKLTAFITVAVMCLAIVITASAIFAPNFYKGSDTEVETVANNPYATYDNGGYDMPSTITFNGSNMKAVRYTGVENSAVSILYPSVIYMDVTETLESLGYYFFVDGYYTGCSQNPGLAIMLNTFGYYNKIPTNTDNNSNYFGTDSEYYALMRVFGDSSNTYRISDQAGIDNCYSIDNASDAYTQNKIRIENSMKIVVPDKKAQHATAKFMVSGKPDSSYISSQKKDSFTYTNTTEDVLFGYQKYRLISSWTNTKNSFRFNFDNVTDSVTLNSIATNYTSSMNISLNIYDKSGLLSAIKTLDAKYDALNKAKLLLDGEESRYEQLQGEVKTLLSKREVVQSALDAKKKEVESYVFNTCVSDPALGSESNPNVANYTGAKYNLNNFWSGYNGLLQGSTNVNLSSCYSSGAMIHSLTGFDGSPTNITDKNNLTEAGYYQVTFTPNKDTMTITVNGVSSIKCKFYWSNGDTTARTAYFRINPADITLPSDMKTAVELTYNGATSNVVTGLPANSEIGLVGTGNVATVQLSFSNLNQSAGVWNASGKTSLEFDDVNDAPRNVYYRISAKNHNDRYGSFTVKINPADISIKIKHFEQQFGSTLLDSDGIFENMLDESTPNILDSTNFNQTEEYLRKILTFVILNNESNGSYDSAVDIPNAGNYTIGAVKTTDAEWAKRINNISFVKSDNSNIASNVNAYQIKPISIEVTWQDNANKWYDSARGHRPSAEPAQGQDTFGQEVTLGAVGVVGDKGTELINGNAVNAGTYTATVSSTNPNFVISNDKYEFSILPRKISIALQNRAITYAQFAQLEDVKKQYETLLKNNTNNEAYIATLDQEIATATGQTNALVQENYQDVFKVNINAETTPDGKFYVAGQHTFEFVSDNNNYDIDSTDGVFTVNPAQLSIKNKQVAPKIYNGEDQMIELPINPGEDGNIALFGYELENYKQCVKIEYSSVGVDGPWSETPLTITNVIQSPMTVYCRISADNHVEDKVEIKQEMAAADILVYFDAKRRLEGQTDPIGQTKTVYYGDKIPESGELLDICRARFDINQKSFDESDAVDSDLLKVINPRTIFEFYLMDPKTGQAIVKNNAGAGTYTVTHRINADVLADINNYNVVYYYDEKAKERDNVDVYRISPKELHVVWAQDRDNWTGEGKDHYIFNNTIPTVFPTVSEDEIVDGDSIYLASQELDGATVNESGYTVLTQLTNDNNKKNYVLKDFEHTFYIDPLEIKIVIKDKYAEYGQTKQIPFGEELVDPITDSSAIWDYAQGSTARFYSDHYRNWKSAVQEYSSENYLLPVNDSGYDIKIVPNTAPGMDGTIRNNYKITEVKEDGKNGKFYITRATLHFTGREFNIAYDLGEDTVLTEDMLVKRISTGIEGVDASQFDIRMSQKIKNPEDGVSYIPVESITEWVKATEAVVRSEDCLRYYVWFVVDGNPNFNEFKARVALNILTDWVSVTIGGGVSDAEYGYKVHTSDQIFASLDILKITGFLSEGGGSQLWDADRPAAKSLLKSYVELFVGTGDLNTEMDKNLAVGDYSIFMRVTKDGDYKNFRFSPRDGESDTSNINAYHVQPRTISVEWHNHEGDYGMDEEYGNHGNSHTGYTIKSVVDGEPAILEGDEELVRLNLIHYVDDSVANNTARFEFGHAFAAGYYVAEVVGVTNPNYRVREGDSELIKKFEIKKKEINIKLLNRDFVYGVENAHIDNINGALNVYSLTPNYEVVDKTPFVGSDKRTDIFEIYFEDVNGLIKEGLNYLPTGTYSICARQTTKAVSANYKINVEGEGTLTIKEAKAGLSVKQLTTLYFDSTYQDVNIESSWLVLAGDVDKLNVEISYKFVGKDDYKDTATAEYIPQGEYKIRDAGRYVFDVKIVADNHEDFYTEVNLNVTPANVIINMNQASKKYGDDLEALKKELPGIESLSDWLKIKCGITIEIYRFVDGGRKQWDITDTAIDDFEFYVVNRGSSSDSDELELGSTKNYVGEYTVYHRMARGDLESNYIVEYYHEQGAASKCNINAYKINPRPVSVDWSNTDAKTDWNSNKTQFYYTGHTPNLVATFVALADENGNRDTVSLQITGMTSGNVGDYMARVEHSVWDTNQYAKNYTLEDDTYSFSIVKRPILVTIANQYKGVYGSVYGNVAVTQGEFSLFDERLNDKISTLYGENPIQLVLENLGVGADKLLSAGSYKISGICHNDNYQVTFAGEDGGDYGWLTIDKARFDFSTTYSYDEAKYLGREFNLDFKQILPINKDAFVEGEDWESAWANAVIAYKQNGVGVDKPVFTGAGKVSVEYRLTFDNYNDFIGTLEVDVKKAKVNVSVSEVSSIYGENLLDSKTIFANANVSLADGSDEIVIAIDEIISLFVDSNAVNAGKYDLEYSYVDNQNSNFTVELIGNADKYVILPRTIELIWAMDEEDEALDSDGKYVFDGKPHKIIFDVDNVLSGDTIDPRFEETDNKDQAGTYTARLISIGTNANYAMPEDCSFEWTIKPRPVTVTWTVEEYTYDGNLKEPVAQIKDGVLLGTSCGVIVTGGEINAGEYEATALTTSDNYVVSNATQAFTIKPKQIQVVWSNDTFVYDGNAHAPTASVLDGQLVEGDIVEEIVVSGAQKNAGTYTATVAQLDNRNYIVVGATKTFTIDKKQVSIHWTDTQFDYTGEEITPNAKLEGVLNGDSVALEISGGKTNVGTYTATATGVSNGNYVLAPNTVKEMEFTIDKVNNEFDGLFGNGDNKGEIVGVPWTGEDVPTNKFGGEVIIKYYDDEACTKEVDVNKIKDGTYWAVAYVAGTENYNELKSNPLKFTIDKGVNVALAVCGIVISVVLLGAVLTIILVINGKKKKGGNA